MKQLSLWAKQHPIAARWWIALGRIFVGTVAVWWGIAFGLAGHDWAEAAFQVSAGAFLLAYATYPVDFLKHNYWRRKCCDALLVVSSLAFWLGWGNWYEAQPPALTAIAPATTVRVAWADSERSHTTAAEWRQWLGHKSWEFRCHYRAAVTELARRWEANDWLVLLGAIGLTFLALLLLYVVAALACGLSCGGQEGAAVVVAVLGVGLVAFGLIWTWRWAALRWRKNRKNRQAPEGSRRLD